MYFFISTSLALLMASAAVNAASCTVASSNGGDDASNIESAFSKCNNGGIVVFPGGTTYNLESVVSISGLQDVTVQFESTVNLPEYNTKFEDEKAFFYIAGDNINWSGSGTFNGNGQGWCVCYCILRCFLLMLSFTYRYDAQNRNAPPLFKPKATNSYFGGFNIKQAPRAHFSVNGCENVLFEKINIHTVSNNSEYDAHNTDAFDVSDSSDITIRSSTIVNGDDCIAVNAGMYRSRESFKVQANNDPGNYAGVTNLTVTDLSCIGSHGFSVGSLGKNGDSETDTVSDLKFISNTCINCQNGVRIKSWPGGKGRKPFCGNPFHISFVGVGFVKNVVFQDIKLEAAENPIIITTHYCDNNQMQYCTGEDTHSLTISDVTISGISG